MGRASALPGPGGQGRPCPMREPSFGPEKGSEFSGAQPPEARCLAGHGLPSLPRTSGLERRGSGGVQVEAQAWCLVRALLPPGAWL